MYEAPLTQTSNQNTIKIQCKNYFLLVYITVMALKFMFSAKKKAKALFITQKIFCKKESLSVLVETTLLTCLKLKINFLRNIFTIFAVLPLATTKSFFNNNIFKICNTSSE